MKRLFVIFLISLMGLLSAFPNPFRYLKTEDGLTSGEINHIVQDPNGVIWMATWTGLIAYDGYQFTNFRPELGNPYSMPDKKVKKLKVDHLGNLWIATEKNLVKMDRATHQFHTFQFNRVSNDPINILQINEISGFLVVHAVEGFYALPVEQLNQPGYKISKIKLFDQDQQLFNYFHYSKGTDLEQLICASNTGALQTSLIYFFKLKITNKDTLLQSDFSLTLKGAVRNIHQPVNKNRLFFATNRGVFTFDPITKQFVETAPFFEGKDLNISLYASDNRIYAASNDTELYYHDLETGQQGKYLANPNLQGTLLNSNILTLFEDFSGNLWIGHQGQGISIMNLYRKEFQTVRRDPLSPKSLSSNAVMCFNGSREHLLVGCRTGGINIARLDKNGSIAEGFDILDPEPYPDLGNNNSGIWDIARQSDNLYWVASSSGLLQLELSPGGWLLKPYGTSQAIRDIIRKIYIDRFNNLWCGTMNYGLVFVPNPETNPQGNCYQFSFDRTDSTSLSDNIVLSIVLDRDDQLWIGTVNGLNRLNGLFHELDLSGKERPSISFRRFVGQKNNNKHLNNNEINSIFPNHDGKIWIATQGGGINIFDKQTETFTYLTAQEGLPGNDVFGIVVDEGNNLWISTDKGLVFYNQSAQNSTLTVYNHSDGLQGDIFMINSCYKSPGGKLYFGGENGFTSFYTMMIKPNSIRPKTIFTELKIFNNMIGIGDTLSRKLIMKMVLNETEKLILPYHKNTLSIGIAAIHYQYPEGNYFSYILEGYDKNWQTLPATEKAIQFTQLPAGDYTLKVFAISSDNIADDQVRSLSIKILPPWYRQWYMNALFLIAGILLITLFVYFIINRQRHVYLQRIYDITLENNESKMTFLANIAHELRTPLSLIISPVKDLMANEGQVEARWHNHIRLIYRNANYLLKLIDQIIDFRRLDAGKLTLNRKNEDVGQLISEVSSNFKAFETSQNISLLLELPEEPIVASLDKQKFEEVLYNLLSNAFKHTPSQKSIRIKVNLETNNKEESSNQSPQIRITVFNEGKLIPEEELDKIFERFYKADVSTDGAGIGLSFAKSLVDMHGGTIQAESIPGQGVAFHVLLPYQLSSPTNENSADNKSGNPVHDEAKDKHNEKVSFPEESENDTEKETKIVIVEDNEELRKFMVEILSRKYSCYEAPEGATGFKITKEIIPDIVITDLVMPKLDGYGLVKLIKEEIKTCHIPVIMLTAKNANENIINGYRSGVDAYVTKPFDTNIILSQISRLIKNRELIHEKYKKQNFMVEVSPQNLSRDDEFLKSIRKLLEKQLGNPDFNVKELSDELQMSTTQLYRKIKSLTGFSPVEFLRITRLHKAHDLLAQQKYSIKEVCFQTGFNNLSYFVKCFREYFGVTPANYRDKGQQ